MSISIFLPVRKGSERVLNKNTRPFAGYQGGLLELKLEQLMEVQGIEEIIVSTNDERCAEIADIFRRSNEKIKIDKRPDNLSSSNTDLVDLIRYVPDIISSEVVLWTHVTSPLCTGDIYKKSIEIYQDIIHGEHDSLMSVHEFKNFLWQPEKNCIINNGGTASRWSRTQDLKNLYEINSAIFLAPRSFYMEGDRIGRKPYLFEINKLSSLDIDNEEDFLIAEAVYERIYR